MTTRRIPTQPIPEPSRRRRDPLAGPNAREPRRTATAPASRAPIVPGPTTTLDGKRPAPSRRAAPASKPTPRNTPTPTKALALTAATLILTACTTLTVDPFPDPVRPAKESPETAEGATPGKEEGKEGEKEEQRGLTISKIPGVIIQRTVAEGIIDQFGRDLTGDPIKVSFHEMPLVAFIDAVFGEQLNMSFVVSPGLQDKKDLVTLRLTEPLPPAELFLWARRALNTYGVDTREEAGVLTFFESDEIASPDIPLLISGRALPEVPATHRTIFQVVPLHVVGTNYVADWLQEVFDGHDLVIDEDPSRNSMLLRGGADIIARAIAMLEVLDQPMLHGRHGFILQPDFLSADDLTSALTAALNAEGYNVAVGRPGGSVMLLPLENINKILVFVVDPAALEHVREWAEILDAEHRDTVEEALFTYEVRNTQAEQLTETLNSILGVGVLGVGVTSPALAQTQPGAAASARQIGGGSIPGRGGIVVDKNRNMILFRGSGKQWADILEAVAQLDRPVPSVLIEVLIAEITLTDTEKSGLDFLFKANAGAMGRNLRFGTRKALDLGAGGLSMTLDSSGETRALLNLFYEDNRVVIRSSPKLFVKSGGTATLEVGNEIPVVTQISDDAVQVDGSTNILQQVAYRKTGVSLEISPIVQANGLVDLEISQELSEAQPTAATSLSGTPTILSRQISTSLTLKDGGSLVMGGLIANNRSAGQKGIPGLGRVPVLGRLFRGDSLQQDRTELLIMVIPYVVADHEEGAALTEELKRQLDLHREFLR